MSDPVTTFLDVLARDPADQTAWLILADALEESGRHAEAEVVRLRERLRFMALYDPDRPSDERRLQELLLLGVPPVGPSLTLPMPEGDDIEFRLIPPGSFWVGSPPDERGRDRLGERLLPLKVSRGFWLATTPLTNAQLRPGGDDHPAIVPWLQTREELLSTYWNRRVRLPYPAHWEYACRAGTTSACHGGDLLAVPNVAWCSYGSRRSPSAGTMPVRSFAPNAWGLYDMHGNVQEWTSDTDGTECQIVKGGSFRCLPSRCRSASIGYQRRYAPHVDDVGVRYLIEIE